MKKFLVLLLMLAIAGFATVSAADKAAKAQAKAQKEALKKEAKKEKEVAKAQKKHQKQLAKELKHKKDVLKNAEYKQIKMDYFNAEGYGDTYNCKVAQQRFCKVKDLDTGVYVLCDREVSRTQMESAKIFYKLGRCTKLN
jgi:restriction endonuclease Mrr